MSENIKEIINDLQRVADRKCYPEDVLWGSIAQEWVDYITALCEENERLNNIIKDIKSQLTYLETYSSKEDVFDDMKRRLDRIEKIIDKGSDKNE